jgi:phosphoglycerate dehydrogenase-like enzyme
MSGADVVVVQPIAATGVERLRAAGLTVHCATDPAMPALGAHLGAARAVITRNLGFSAAAIAAAPRLVAIVSHGTGTDSIDRAAAAARGIAVLNTPGTNAQAVAEHAMGLILACARGTVAADAAVRGGDWGWRERRHGVELAGRTLGLIGWGHVAARLARLACGFGMAVLVHSARAAPAALAAEGATAAGLDALGAASDVVSLHGRPGAAPLVDTAFLARLKSGAILVNTARGALVDEAALAAALHAGHLRAAALDVFAPEPPHRDSPLFAAPNLILTPHIGGSTAEAMDRTALAAAEAVIGALAAAPR